MSTVPSGTGGYSGSMGDVGQTRLIVGGQGTGSLVISNHSKQLGEEIAKRQRRLEYERQPEDSLWDDVDTYITPRRAKFDVGGRHGEMWDQPVGAGIYDGTAQQALSDFADMLQSQSASAMFDWWAPKLRNKEAMALHEVKQWLDDVKEAQNYEMAASNFYEELNEAYKDGPTYGNAHMYGPEWDADKRVLVYLTRHPREIFYATDAMGRINIWHRKYALTGRQIFAEFGEDTIEDPKTREAMSRNPYRKWYCIHAIFPRTERDIRSPLAIDKPYASVYVLETDKQVLQESGYDELDLPDTWRWTGNVIGPYPSSPAIDGFYDVATTNSATKSMLMAAQLAVEPARLITADMQGEVNDFPGGETILTNPGASKVEPMDYPANFQVGMATISELRQQLQRKFKADIATMMAGLPANASVFQASSVAGEKAALLVPFTSRAQSQLLVPKINKTFRCLMRAGRLPVPPPSIMQYVGTPVDIQMMGPVTLQAKRYLSTQGFMAFLGIMAEMDKTMPEAAAQVRQGINGDEVRKFIIGYTGAPERIVLDDKVIAQIRQKAAAAQEAQQKAELLDKTASAYQKGTGAPQEGSAAEKLMSTKK